MSKRAFHCSSVNGDGLVRALMPYPSSIPQEGTDCVTYLQRHPRYLILHYTRRKGNKISLCRKRRRCGYKDSD